jgi:hypothetical protein
MADIRRVNGGVGIEGVLNGVTGAQSGASVRFLRVTVRNASNTVQDLRPEMASGVNGGLGGVVETILRAAPSGILAYFVPNDSSGIINIVVDAHAAFDATTGSTTQPGFQEMVRALGANVPTVAGPPMDVTGSLVAAGTGFTIS